MLCSQYGRTVNGTTAYSRLRIAGSTLVVIARSSPHTRLPLTYQLLRIGIRRRYLSYRYRRGTAVRRRVALIEIIRVT